MRCALWIKIEQTNARESHKFFKMPNRKRPRRQSGTRNDPIVIEDEYLCDDCKQEERSSRRSRKGTPRHLIEIASDNRVKYADFKKLPEDIQRVIGEYVGIPTEEYMRAGEAYGRPRSDPDRFRKVIEEVPEEWYQRRSRRPAAFPYKKKNAQRMARAPTRDIVPIDNSVWLRYPKDEIAEIAWAGHAR